MKILHIAPEYKWSKIFIAPIVKKQIDNNNQVWISTSNSESIGEIGDDINYVSWNKKYKDIIKHVLSIFLIIKMVRYYKIEQIFCHTTVDSTLYILALRLFTSTKIVYVNHGVPYLGYHGIMSFILKMCEIINLNFSHYTITITDSMKKLLLPFSYTKKTIISLNPGTLVGVQIPYSSYEILLEARNLVVNNSDSIENKLRIIYVGRLEERKGIYDLLTSLEQTNLDCELIVLGEMEEGVKKFYNQDKVKFLGFQNDLSSYYLSSDILCVPSHHEGFGQVYLEAASYGVIPICCDIPGPTDFIKHGFNGLIVKPSSPNSIAGLLDQIHIRFFDLDKLKKNAYETAKVYESSSVINKNMDFFK